MLINKADRTTQGFVKRLEHFRANAHLMGGPDGLFEISREIRAGELIGTREELSVLQALHAAIANDMGNQVAEHENVRKTNRFLFEKKRGVAHKTRHPVKVHVQRRAI